MQVILEWGGALGLGERVRRGRLGFGKVRRVQAWQERGAPPGGRGESTGQAAGAGSQGSPPAPAAGSPGSGGTSGTPGVTPGGILMPTLHIFDKIGERTFEEPSF